MNLAPRNVLHVLQKTWTRLKKEFIPKNYENEKNTLYFHVMISYTATVSLYLSATKTAYCHTPIYRALGKHDAHSLLAV